MSDYTMVTIKITQIAVEMLNNLADRYGVEPRALCDRLFNASLEHAWQVDEFFRSKSNKESFPPHPLSKKTNNISNIENNKSIPIVATKSLDTILDGAFAGAFSPLEKKAAAKKGKKKKPNLPPPKNWVDDADSDKIPLDLYSYAETRGYDYHQAREMFADFIIYHLKRGNVFADWSRAWQTWVRNQIKFKKPIVGTDDNSVVRSYKKFNADAMFAKD